MTLIAPTRTLIVGGGGRSQVPESEKYARDANTLEQALLQEPGNARYAFYLAQSYRDAGQLEKALAAYERRATMGGFEQEVYISLLAAGYIHLLWLAFFGSPLWGASALALVVAAIVFRYA